jgi:hypothetical protein
MFRISFLREVPFGAGAIRMIGRIRGAGRAVGALVLLGLAGPWWGAAASGADVVGTVESVDRVARTVVVVQDGTGREVEVKVTPTTAIEVHGEQGIDLEHLEEGTHVVVLDNVVAAAIRVENEVVGAIRSVDPEGGRLAVDEPGQSGPLGFRMTPETRLRHLLGRGIGAEDLRPGMPVTIVHSAGVATRITVEDPPAGMVGEFWDNVRHNLFKPLLLFFYAGFLIPLLGVKFEFPYVIYQGLTIYLLIAIGWHGGEELAMLDASSLGTAAGFMGVGFVTNLGIGLLAYGILRGATRLRRIDAATVAGYYGSDSAGTFVTCLGVLASLHLAYAPYMPVMLAVMEIPGCLVALMIVSSLRKKGLDAEGNCPDEPGYGRAVHTAGEEHRHELEVEDEEKMALERGYIEHEHHAREHEHEHHVAHEPGPERDGKPPGPMSRELLHEVFLNPGIYLLFAGILIGFISRLQGPEVTNADDRVFLDLFPGLLCLFLLEMGMTASRKLKDLRVAGPPFIAFGLLAPNAFATIGIAVAHAYSMILGEPLDLGTYALFAVLCGASSYIAVPAVQRLAIPEASPTLPLAASLGLTFTYNVTIGIPVYIEIAKLVTRMLPVG